MFRDGRPDSHRAAANRCGDFLDGPSNYSTNARYHPSGRACDVFDDGEEARVTTVVAHSLTSLRELLVSSRHDLSLKFCLTRRQCRPRRQPVRVRSIDTVRPLWLLLRGVRIETLHLLRHAHLQRPKSVVRFRPLFLYIAEPFLEFLDGLSKF